MKTHLWLIAVSALVFSTGAFSKTKNNTPVSEVAKAPAPAVVAVTEEIEYVDEPIEIDVNDQSQSYNQLQEKIDALVASICTVCSAN